MLTKLSQSLSKQTFINFTKNFRLVSKKNYNNRGPKNENNPMNKLFLFQNIEKSDEPKKEVSDKKQTGKMLFGFKGSSKSNTLEENLVIRSFIEVSDVEKNQNQEMNTQKREEL